MAVALCVGLLTLNAADKKHLGGPKGGRLLEKTDPKAEFFLEKDHTVTITFYEDKLQPISLAGFSRASRNLTGTKMITMLNWDRSSPVKVL